MTTGRRSATLDHRREQKAAQWLARFRASLCGVFALAGTAILVDALVDGRFASIRHFGTIAFDEQPIGFVLIAILWAGMVGLLTLCCALFARQAHTHVPAPTRSTNFSNK